MRVLFVFGVVVYTTSLAGCALSGMTGYPSAASKAYYHRDPVLTQRLGAASALAALPASAGRVLEVDQTRYSNGLAQKIILAGGLHGYGSNEIDIRVQISPNPNGTAKDPVTLPAGDDRTIADELGTRFPTLAMHDVPVLLQNHYGPYGLAAGTTAAGEHCIYAWQKFDDFGHRNHATPASLVSGLVAPREPATIRVRLCQKGVSADALGGLMNNLYLTGSGGSAQQVLVDPQIDRLPGMSPDALGPASPAIHGGFSGYRMPEKRVVLERYPHGRRRFIVTRRAHYAPPHVAITRARSIQMPYQLPAVAPNYVAAPATLVNPSPGSMVQAPAVLPRAAPTPVAAPVAEISDLPPQATQGPQGPQGTLAAVNAPVMTPRQKFTKSLHPNPGNGSATIVPSNNAALLQAHTLNGFGS